MQSAIRGIYKLNYMSNKIITQANRSVILFSLSIGLGIFSVHAFAESVNTDTQVIELQKKRNALNQYTGANTLSRNIDITNKEWAEKQQSTKNIVMYSGEVITIQTDRISRVAIGNGKLVSATVIDDNKLLVIAQEVGDTNIILWRENRQFENIKIRVTAIDFERLLDEVKGILEDIQGIKIRKYGNSIFIDGENLKPEDLASINAVKEQFPNVVDRTTGMQQQARPAPTSSMIMFDVYFVELKKNYLQDLGVSWQKSFNGLNFGIFGEATRGPLTLRPASEGAPVYDPPLPPGRIAGVSTALNISAAVPGIINLAVSKGEATLLAAPKLAVRSGGKAKFLAGGEFPIPISGITGNSVDYKDYGILLEVSPVINEDKTVSGSISTEVSALDPSVSVNGYPGLLKRRTDTDFYTEMGQAIVLSGLYTQESSQADDKVPLLGDVPVLNFFFKSRGEIRTNTELVVFIIPTSHSSQDKKNAEIINSSRESSQRLNKLIMGHDVLPKLKLESQIWREGTQEFTRDHQADQNPPDATQKMFLDSQN